MSGNDVWHVEESVPDLAKLGQGDLLRFGAKEPYTYGVVVTADCDLDKKKHSRIVTYVSLISSADVICESLIHDLVSRREGDCAKILCKHFKLSKDSPLSTQTQVLAILKGNGFAVDCSVSDDVDCHTLLALVYCGYYSRPTIAQCKAILSLLGVTWADAAKNFSNQIASRGDFLTLSSPPHADSGIAIAWLRAVKQCQISAIALRTSEAQEEGKVALRIAKLKSPFVYRLTQMLGQVFSDIGLPDLPKVAIDGEA